MQETQVSTVVTDDFIQCWQATGRHLQCQVEGGPVWIRAHLDQPFMEHLSFRLGNQLFFVRIEDADGQLKTPGSEAALQKIAENAKDMPVSCRCDSRSDTGCRRKKAGDCFP